MREIKFRAWNKEKMAEFDLEDLMYGTHNLDTVDLKYWKVMQYTGLKDKNGKEIYEGDIIQFPNSVMYEVKFYRSSFVYINSMTGFTHLDLENFVEDMSVIIGNIYEKPELLNKEI